jgi:hypothetical protein
VDSNFQFVRRHHAHITDDYRFELDEYGRAGGGQLLLAHLRFFKWTPSVLKAAIREWKLLRSCVTAPLFACPETDDAKWVKFVTKFGFKPLATTLCNNGAQRPLFIHVI